MLCKLDFIEFHVFFETSQTLLFERKNGIRIPNDTKGSIPYILVLLAGSESSATEITEYI